MAAIPVLNLQKNIANTKTFIACDVAGDTVLFNSDTSIEVANGDASAHQVTITAIKTTCSCDGSTLTVPNIVASIPAGESRTFILTSQYYDAVNNGAQIAYDDVTSMTIAAYV